MTKNRSAGDFDVIFKYIVPPQFSKAKILTPIFYRQGFIPSLEEKKHRQLLKMSHIPLQEIRSRAYGVWQKSSGLNQRGRFIINPDGIIKGVEILIWTSQNQREKLAHKN